MSEQYHPGTDRYIRQIEEALSCPRRCALRATNAKPRWANSEDIRFDSRLRAAMLEAQQKEATVALQSDRLP